MTNCVMSGILVIVTLLAVQLLEGKHWPNFNCYPVNASSLQERRFSYNRMGWNTCLEPYQNWNGKCPQVCMLIDDQIVYRMGKNGPVVFNTTSFMTYFAEEQGYNPMADNGEGVEQDLMKKIHSGLEECRKKYPEHEGLTNLKKAKCEEWDNILKCIELAVGCGPWSPE